MTTEKQDTESHLKEIDETVDMATYVNPKTKGNGSAGDVHILDKPTPEPEQTPQMVIDAIVEATKDKPVTVQDWASLAYEANLYDSDVDEVINWLVKSKLGKKRALTRDWKKYSEKRRRAENFEADHTALEERRNGRTRISYDPANLNAMLRLCEQEMLDDEHSEALIRFGEIYGRIGFVEPAYMHAIDAPDDPPPKVPRFQEHEKHRTRLRIENSVMLTETRRTRDGEQTVPIAVPYDLANMMIQNPAPRTPDCRGLVSHPVVTPDGEIVNTEGYDPGSRLVLSFGGATFPELPAWKPDSKDGRALLARANEVIVEEFLGEFEFEPSVLIQGITVPDLDLSGAIAFLLTTLQRRLMDMAPAFHLGASLQGSGKTTLARMVHVIATACDMPVASFPKDSTEAAKTILSFLLSSPEMICLDNIKDGLMISDSMLAQIITSPVYKSRVLGLSRDANVPTSTTVVTTGNNNNLDTDLVRRFLCIQLTPKTTRPANRIFKHPVVVQRALNLRMKVVSAALSMIINYLRNPGVVDENIHAPSGFHSWDRLVRYPIVAAGHPDPWLLVERNAEASDEMQSRVSVVHALHDYFTGKKMSVVKDAKTGDFSAADICHYATEKDCSSLGGSPSMSNDALSLRAAIMNAKSRALNNAKSMGHLLRTMLGREMDGLELKEKITRGSKLYWVEKVEGAGEKSSSWIQKAAVKAAVKAASKNHNV